MKYSRAFISHFCISFHRGNAQVEQLLRSPRRSRNRRYNSQSRDRSNSSSDSDNCSSYAGDQRDAKTSRKDDKSSGELSTSSDEESQRPIRRSISRRSP
jgi:hypothetical protein